METCLIGGLQWQREATKAGMTFLRLLQRLKRVKAADEEAKRDTNKKAAGSFTLTKITNTKKRMTSVELKPSEFILKCSDFLPSVKENPLLLNHF